MKTCKNCKEFIKDTEICKIHSLMIHDKTVATYCSKYNESRHLYKGKVQCINCSKMNRYGWCAIKMRCFTEEEQKKERTCIKYYARSFKKAHVKKSKKKK